MQARPFVDFHCHLDLYPDYHSVLRECERAQIRTLAVTTTPRAWPHNAEQLRDAKYVRAALGIHPQLTGVEPDALRLFERYLPETRYVGEVGLDASPAYYKTLPEQTKTFERILRLCAEQGGKILTIHSLRSVRSVLDLLEDTAAAEKSGVVLHWFTGTHAELQRASDLGSYFSVNQAMLATDRSRALVKQIPLDRMLTETDGPFTKVGDRNARPVDVMQTVDSLAALHGLTATDIRSQVGANLARLVAGARDSKDAEAR